ncbi:hypothetical protein MWN63_15640 [Paradonghicola geojensis]|nr:hypothetical protein [Marivivens geojensis]
MKNLILSAAALASLAACAVNQSQDPHWLFAQTSERGHITENVLTVSAENDIFAFTDRPYRDHAYVAPSEFVELWGPGEVDFASNPPNAIVSWSQDGDIVQAEIEILGASYNRTNQTISYDIAFETSALVGDIHSVAVFIDDAEWFMKMGGDAFTEGFGKAPDDEANRVYNFRNITTKPGDVLVIGGGSTPDCKSGVILNGVCQEPDN